MCASELDPRQLIWTQIYSGLTPHIPPPTFLMTPVIYSILNLQLCPLSLDAPLWAYYHQQGILSHFDRGKLSGMWTAQITQGP